MDDLEHYMVSCRKLRNKVIDLESLCRKLAEACKEALRQLDPLEKGDSISCENVIKSIEAALEAAKKTGIII